MSGQNDDDYYEYDEEQEGEEEEEEEVDYHEHQREYNNLRDEWNEREGWTNDDEIGQLERMRLATQQEREGREQAREWGADDDGHEGRIDILRGNEQLLGHAIAHREGDYEYETEGMRDVNPDAHRGLEEENTQEESDRRARMIEQMGGAAAADENNDVVDEEDSDMDIDDSDEDD